MTVQQPQQPQQPTQPWGNNSPWASGVIQPVMNAQSVDAPYQLQPVPQQQLPIQQTPVQPVPQQQVQPQQPVTLTDVQLQQLAAYMANVQPTQQQVSVEQPQQPVVPTQDNTAQKALVETDVNSEQFQQLNEQFKAVMGIDLKAAVQAVQEMQVFATNASPYIEQQKLAQAEQQLKQLWGVSDYEYTQRLNAVAEGMKTLPPDEFKKFDAMGVDGVDLFYRRYVATPNARVVPFDRSVGVNTAQQQRQEPEQALRQFVAGQSQESWDAILQQFAG